jgi:BMFP domain-containing protein YqiC
MDPKFLDDLARKLANAVPAGVRDLQQDVEKNIRGALEGTFSKLNLVSREEFEVQAAVLARTRAKVDELEKKVADLEAQLGAGKQ